MMIPTELNFLRLLRRLQRRADQGRFVLMHLERLDPLPLGPGWFDSSWELECGLEVRENVELDAESKACLEDAMIASALARLRHAAARAAKARKATEKAPGADAPAAPGAATPCAESKLYAALRGDNLIEFESADLSAFRLPALRAAGRTALPELELALA